MDGFKCALVGDGLLLVECAQLLLGRSHEIALIASANPHIRKWAQTHHLLLVEPDRLDEELSGLSYDWLFSIANLRVLSGSTLQSARHGAINFHDALLPEQAGLNTPAWAILEGRQQHGVTWHAMTEKVDAGAIYVQTSFEIAPDETAFTLNSKCFEAGISSFGQLVEAIEQDRLVPQRQAGEPHKVYRRADRPIAAATLDFTKPAEELDRLVRALDFGDNYPNPLATPKLRHDHATYQIKKLAVLNDTTAVQPGAVLAVEGDTLKVAAADRPVLLTLAHPRQQDSRRPRVSIRTGDVLSAASPHERDNLSAAVSKAARHETDFRRNLADRIDISLNDIKDREMAVEPDWQAIPLAGCDGLSRSERIALICAFLARSTQQMCFDVAYSCDGISNLCSAHPGYFSSSVPLRFEVGETATPQEAVAMVHDRLSRFDRQITYLSDLADRYGELDDSPLTCGIVDTQLPPLAKPLFGCALTFRMGANNCDLLFDQSRVKERRARALAHRLAIFAPAFRKNDGNLQELPLLEPAERDMILSGWNRSEKQIEQSACIHHLIERQASLTPDAEAVSSGIRHLSYHELDERADQLARTLRRRGVHCEDIVGLYLPRTVDLVVAALAVWKAGGAYLPLDPDFPADRLSYMVSDSQTKLILATRDHPVGAVAQEIPVLYIEDAIGEDDGALPPVEVAPHNLAYVIYTSGSTGRPKGVMVEHCNVVNFFAGMDDRIPVYDDRANVWLAVTSLSFDISVLELFWTLSRGFKVVVHASEIALAKSRALTRPATGELSFGLFYWGNDASAGPSKYRLLMEGAQFADTHGFDAIWTPERHFHAFGGPFPNPAVAGAAIAAVTKNLSIRAGSCVLPLHHPIRVAEEWAVVDNLSNGRVGLAFASGWMPEDFVLRPENAPPLNKAKLISDIDVVRRLWRGEEVGFALGDQAINVVTQPRPVQAELPIWLTTAGNPESYRDAARAGANVLTHLLGQSIAELRDKITLYREELTRTGKNPADFKVTLMLHTLIGTDREAVREVARGPLKDYLRSAAALIKQYAWAFPAFKKPSGVVQPMDIDLRSLSLEELDAVLDFAFDRYFEDSGLFGTVEDALARLEEVRDAGIDEIGCLIDWGLPEDVALEGLRPLATVVERVRNQSSQENVGGFAEDVARHKVTHLQATPSMMRSFMMSDEDRAALGTIRQILVGGEALHGTLVAALAHFTTAPVQNMYGPTETTIWSSSAAAQACSGVVAIGRPIANTQLYILDKHRQPVPPGDLGELFIGGDGVTRGYLNRDDLTRERFYPNPFAPGRIYRTGDLARFDDSGLVHFVGRNDQQIKIRGYRIEIGEIEAQIASFPGVAEAVVTARRDDAGETRLVAYLRVDDAGICEQTLRESLRAKLPDAMIPADIVTLDEFPLTPNAKVDRNRLPMPSAVRPITELPFIAPAGDIEQAIAMTFARTLGRERVSRHDNFFALGGHSLLAVQMHRELKTTLAPQLTITDVFRFPTIASLAAHISGDDGTHRELSKAADRASMRRQALQERQSRLRADALV